MYYFCIRKWPGNIINKCKIEKKYYLRYLSPLLACKLQMNIISAWWWAEVAWFLIKPCHLVSLPVFEWGLLRPHVIQMHHLRTGNTGISFEEGLIWEGCKHWKRFLCLSGTTKITRSCQLSVNLTLASCAWSLFFASATSAIRLLKAKLVLMKWFHISSDVLSSLTSASSRSLAELALACWEHLILSSLNLAHVAGIETLVRNLK